VSRFISSSSARDNKQAGQTLLLPEASIKEPAAAGNQNVLSIAKQVQSVARAALDLLFPPRCVTCKRVGPELCDGCVAEYRPVGDSVCRICGEPRAMSGLCARCAACPPAYKQIRSAYRFDGGVRQAIHALKYNGRRGLAASLAAAAALKIPIPPQGVVVCPVPLYPARQAERGYNQARLLAAELASCWGLVCLSDQALQRTRPTSSQVGLDYDARQANMCQAFSAEPSLVAGLAIILVDDVCTTGATMNACAEALLAAGALSVEGVTVARATSYGKA
jgi:ComF family protein